MKLKASAFTCLSSAFLVSLGCSWPHCTPHPHLFNREPEQGASPLENHREQMLLFPRHGNNGTGNQFLAYVHLTVKDQSQGSHPDHLCSGRSLRSSAECNTDYPCKACACAGRLCLGLLWLFFLSGLGSLANF